MEDDIVCIFGIYRIDDMNTIEREKIEPFFRKETRIQFHPIVTAYIMSLEKQEFTVRNVTIAFHDKEIYKAQNNTIFLPRKIIKHSFCVENLWSNVWDVVDRFTFEIMAVKLQTLIETWTKENSLLGQEAMSMNIFKFNVVVIDYNNFEAVRIFLSEEACYFISKRGFKNDTFQFLISSEGEKISFYDGEQKKYIFPMNAFRGGKYVYVNPEKIGLFSNESILEFRKALKSLVDAVRKSRVFPCIINKTDII